MLRRPRSGGPIDDKAAKFLEDYLRTHEARIYDAIVAELTKSLPDPARPAKELVDTIRETLEQLGVGVSSEEVAKQLSTVLPQEIVRPLVEVHGLIAPRLEWVMKEVVAKANPAIDQLRDAVLAPIDAKLREIFHAFFTTVTRKVAEVIGKLVVSAMLKLLEAVRAVLEKLVAAVMQAVAKLIAMVIQAMVEFVTMITRAVIRFAMSVATWIARKLAMFVIKMILKLLFLPFGLPASQFEITWMETQAMVRV
ncbi:MAG TPA: hypothetical protein VGR95_12235 [Thermoanaerobaculia bacterium]|nr:hypothetical protein [Thermoanaerobaculia bacterium]